MMRNMMRYACAMLFVVWIPLAGCSSDLSTQFTDFSTVDKAAASATYLGYTYKGVYDTYSQVYTLASAEQKETLKTTINPIMNKAKYTIALLIESIGVWKNTATKPANILQLASDAQSLLAETVVLVGKYTSSTTPTLEDAK